MSELPYTPPLPRWTKVLILACCVIEIGLQVATLAGYPLAAKVAFMLGGFWSPIIFQGHGVYPGQPLLMFLTYGLLHAGLLHLAMNMISLAAVARELARFVSAKQMALIYLLSQIGAAALFALMSPAGGPMVGASGAIFGLAGALIGQAIRWRRGRGLPMQPVWKAVLVIGGLNIALTLAMPSIAWQAHLGGTLTGFAMGFFLPLTRDRDRMRRQA